MPPPGETSEGPRQIDLCGDEVHEQAKYESGHLCEGAKDVPKITNQSSYPKTVRYQVSHLIFQTTNHQASDFTYQYDFQTQHGNHQVSQQKSDISNLKPHTSIVKSQSISATAARFLILDSCYMGFRFWAVSLGVWGVWEMGSQCWNLILWALKLYAVYLQMIFELLDLGCEIWDWISGVWSLMF